jgi:hypothetical protein
MIFPSNVFCFLGLCQVRLQRARNPGHVGSFDAYNPLSMQKSAFLQGTTTHFQGEASYFLMLDTPN